MPKKAHLGTKSFTKDEAIVRSRECLAKNALFLDTETTGISRKDSVIEICLLDNKGKVLFESLIKPPFKPTKRAFKIHGIRWETLLSAPDWTEVYRKIKALLDRNRAVAYNSPFDAKIIAQTNAFYHLEPFKIHWQCAMFLFSLFRMEYVQTGTRLKRYKLKDAAEYLGLKVDQNLHRAKQDAALTLNVVKAMAKTELTLGRTKPLF